MLLAFIYRRSSRMRITQGRLCRPVDRDLVSENHLSGYERDEGLHELHVHLLFVDVVVVSRGRVVLWGIAWRVAAVPVGPLVVSLTVTARLRNGGGRQEDN